MYAMTGKTEYRDLYFEEANTTRRREKALEELKKYFADTDSFTALETALSRLQELMETEYYSMRLVAESYGKSEESLPEEIRDVQLSTEDKALSAQDKRTKAQDIVCQKILKKVSKLLKDAFRSIDYVCRIGGDEFAIIMVEMTSDLQYTISDKVKAVNERACHDRGWYPGSFPECRSCLCRQRKSRREHFQGCRQGSVPCQRKWSKWL